MVSVLHLLLLKSKPPSENKMRIVARRRLDSLFFYHMCSAYGCGIFCLLCPRAFLWFLHETLVVNLAGYEVAETIIRLYGSLIFAQGILVKSTRGCSEPKVRKAFVQAYTLAFGLTTASLLYAQYIEHFSIYNWANIVFFASLFGGYSYFAFFEKISTFSTTSDEKY